LFLQQGKKVASAQKYFSPYTYTSIREEQRLRVLENMVLRIFGPEMKKQEVGENCITAFPEERKVGETLFIYLIAVYLMTLSVSSDYIEPNDWITANNELRRIWKMWLWTNFKYQYGIHL
jgi:hypothetical protein